MVIAKTASRNVAFKAAKLGDSIFGRQFEILRTEAVTVKFPSHEENLDDVVAMRICFHMLLNKTRFKVVVVMNVHNK